MTVQARPAHPERICWGCARRCPAGDLACGEDKARAPHPVELFGDDWNENISGTQASSLRVEDVQ